MPNVREIAVSSIVSTLLVACGGAPKPDAPKSDVAAPSATAPAASSRPDAPKDSVPEKDAKEKKKGLSLECAKDGPKDLCVPEPDTGKRICSMTTPELALALFHPKTPFTRAYLTRDTEAWNAAGGAQSKGKLSFDEEVIVVKKRESSGIVVGQGGGVDVLRWDGSCASLAAEEITTKKPPKAKAANVAWREIGGSTRDALLKDEKVMAAYDKRRKECKGVTTGDVSLACVKADAALSVALVEAVRGGLSLPMPE